MSKKIALKENFYGHFNQEWIDQTTLPDGYSSWGSFEILHQKSLDNIKDLIFELKNKQTLDLTQSQIVNLYDNYLNMNVRNEQGIAPIKPMINKIDQLKSKQDFTQFLIEYFQEFKISFFHAKSIDSDFKNSSQRALSIDAMGLGMMDRDFYDPTNPRHDDLKKAYQIYINDLVQASGIEFQQTNVFETVFAFETEISQAMFKQEELRNPENVYNVVDFLKLKQICSFIDWENYLNQTGHAKASLMIVSQVKFLEKLNEMLIKMDLQAMKDLMKFKILSSFSTILTEQLYDINFAYAAAFSGVQKKKPVIDRAVEFTNAKLGELLGQEYIKKHFSEASKQDVLQMVHDLIRIYSNRIQKLAWMSDPTKQKAIEKLHAITIKIGYPDKWDDYSAIVINNYQNGGSLVENVMNLSRFFIEKDLREINLPVDRDKWWMDPQTVNAYYNPTTNEICFPAGILQAPFYDINQSKAQNLGGIGAVIGHEVSHGFDDQGSQFDKVGNLNNWWTEQDYEQYRAHTQKLVEQFNQYQVNGINVNGNLTLGENIGDLSGMAAALDICQEQSPNDLKAFFENNAIIWRRKATAEIQKTKLFTDPHSPEEFRCNGILINLDEFHETYQTQPGDGMYLASEKRIKVW
ncbi:M13 family metallopeptidase [Williamsoniiplasma lucivorax]|uniref:Endopeptidase O n=1 Tax=Williamsoniiplasma lucivorax TaxID=209274 RepID=A0A2S5REK1_9MOLU|nr:M13 family metallopeptidase [Williamsoniiplasma lucivorax]PPE05741.1 endopeptidase O [Williamsoniiplasma lucivorax]